MKAHTVWFLRRWSARLQALADPIFAVGLGAVIAYGVFTYLSR
jgi:hypothetical protein